MRTVRVARIRSPGNQNINQPITLERKHRTVNSNKSVPVLRMLFAYSHQSVKYPQSIISAVGGMKLGVIRRDVHAIFVRESAVNAAKLCVDFSFRWVA